MPKQAVLGKAEQDELVLANRGLAHAMSIKIWKAFPQLKYYYTDLDDVIQEAYIVLMRSAAAFDPSRGIKFTTYACNAIIKTVGKPAFSEKHYPFKTPFVRAWRRATGNNLLDNSDTQNDPLFSDHHSTRSIEQFESQETCERYLNYITLKHRRLLKSYFGIGCKEKNNLREVAKELRLPLDDIHLTFKKAVIALMREVRKRKLQGANHD